ncbi:unnamed protein product [Echinostoma caproni]|uniref:Uncharacterized protein n=1 Tax=Echinostoma caproni TaxID=27848 RepID=A0A183ABH5_9TREM|nr:unnamed protein product [Echinostoma caproni]
MRTDYLTTFMLLTILHMVLVPTEQAFIRPFDFRARRAYISSDLDLDNPMDFGIALGTRRLTFDQPDDEPRLRGSVMRYGK